MWNQAVAWHDMIFFESSHHDSGWSTEIVQHAIYRIEKVNQTRIVYSKKREKVDERKARIPFQEVVVTKEGSRPNFGELKKKRSNKILKDGT